MISDADLPVSLMKIETQSNVKVWEQTELYHGGRYMIISADKNGFQLSRTVVKASVLMWISLYVLSHVG